MASWGSFTGLDRLFLAAVLGSLACLGCGPAARQPAEQPASKIAMLARFYGEYAARNQGRIPADEAAFKAYLSNLPAAQRESMGLHDPASAFVSPRDGKPYVLAYGNRTLAALGGAGLNGQPIVAYEQAGHEGKRLVANAMGATAELSETEFTKAVPQSK